MILFIFRGSFFCLLIPFLHQEFSEVKDINLNLETKALMTIEMTVGHLVVVLAISGEDITTEGEAEGLLLGTLVQWEMHLEMMILEVDGVEGCGAIWAVTWVHHQERE